MTSIPAAGRTVERTDNQPDPILALRQRVDDLVKNTNDWIKAVPVVTSEEQAMRLEDALQQLRDEFKAVDDARRVEKKPHDDAVLEVQERYKPLLDLLVASAEALKPLRSAWLQELRRRLDEDRLKKAQEAADAAKAAAAAQAKVDGQMEAATAGAPMVAVASSTMTKIGYVDADHALFIQFTNALWRYTNVPKWVYDGLLTADSKGTYYGKFIKGKYPSQAVAVASVQDQVNADQAQQRAGEAASAANQAMGAKAQVRGAFGKRATGLRTVWYADVTNYDLALAHYQNQPEVRDLIQQLANADARKIKDTGPTIPGVAIKNRQE